MEIFPAIDIKAGKVVRLVRGDYDQQIDYPADPVDVAGGFLDAGADWLHVVDLDGARTGTTSNTDTIKKILGSVELKVQIGGGIRTRRSIMQLLDAGATRVIIGTRSLEDWDWFRDTVHQQALAGKIVLGIDARDGKLAVRGWTEQTDVAAVDVASRVRGWALAAIVYTDISRDGMLAGPNLDRTQEIAESTDVPVIASGGVTSIDDVRRLTALPVAGAIIGRALYEGKIDLAEAIRAAGFQPPGNFKRKPNQGL